MSKLKTLPLFHDEEYAVAHFAADEKDFLVLPWVLIQNEANKEITEIYEYEKRTTYIHVNWKYELIKDSKVLKINYWWYSPFNIFGSFYKIQNTKYKTYHVF